MQHSFCAVCAVGTFSRTAGSAGSVGFPVRLRQEAEAGQVSGISPWLVSEFHYIMRILKFVSFCLVLLAPFLCLAILLDIAILDTIVPQHVEGIVYRSFQAQQQRCSWIF